MSNQPAILYVEDNPQSRRLMQMLLERRMKLAHVTILENSENFLECMQALSPKPDLIFLDIHMRPYDGFEMLEMLRRLPWAAQIPIVALTASVMSDEVQKLRKVGFNGCLAKPIDITGLPDTIARILAGEAIWRITK